MNPTPRRIAWFSRGAASAVAAKLAVEADRRTLVVCIPLVDEHEDSIRFSDDVQEWIGKRILNTHSREFEDTFAVWEARRSLKGPAGAPCTIELKKKVRWRIARPDDVNIMGYTVDEPHRAERLRANEPGVDFEFPLIDAGFTKKDCFQYLVDAGIDLPEMYKLGYDNNNCIGCVKGGVGYWNAIREDFPEKFDRMARLERELDFSLLRDKRGGVSRPLFLDELEPGRGNFKRDQPPSCGFTCPTDYEEDER